MKSGGGARKKGDGDGMVSAGTQMLETEGPAAGEIQKGNMHVEAGEEAAEAVGGDGHGALPGEEEEQDDEGGWRRGAPKLEDGFYEIEDIRKKRMRKGQLQYLIKWRGWPETANTWEPFDNVKSCADIIEAFEERHKVPRATRKRKRKGSGSLSIGRKKRDSGKKQGDDTVASSREKVKSKAPDLHNINGYVSGVGPSETGGAKGSLVGGGEDRGGEGNTMHVDSKPNGDDREQKEKTDHNKEPGSIKLGGLDSTEEGAGPVSINLRLEEDRLSKIESLAQHQSGARFTGAKKRKSGCIRRFKQDASDYASSSQSLVTRSMNKCPTMGEKMGNEDAVPTGVEAGDKYRSDGSTRKDALMKILKTVACSASISNDVQDVSVTFVALRSDGREVQVDNEFLKAHYPAMLIDFYEQHLRFGSS
ncbi:unnamed protein product [Spirodela intermedia]|uniref:Chromo domain-containing protein n=1 Tax=Spirodela intermedia TaxID=51605 RepID=A0A7I8JHT9_SPIIN|nr:unnamed protein product [Spirodela intermedia]CAA6669481.1 unnamed protein product [Spirodela intermedia]